MHLNYNEFNELESYEFELPEETVIEGVFEQEDDERQMAIRKLNFTLCIMLIALIAITTVSYYFATAHEMTLNKISRETVVLNDENSELENQLDRMKSFNNVDKSMQKNNLLSKAKQVIEVTEVDTANVAKADTDQKVLNWAIGYYFLSTFSFRFLYLIRRMIQLL